MSEAVCVCLCNELWSLGTGAIVQHPRDDDGRRAQTTVTTDDGQGKTKKTVDKAKTHRGFRKASERRLKNKCAEG